MILLPTNPLINGYNMKTVFFYFEQYILILFILQRRSLSNEDVLESPKTRRQHKSLTASTAMDPTDYVAPSPILRSKSGVATSRFSVHDSSSFIVLKYH